jgi:diguanylate cyclase (GGDEF)-like protein
MLNRAFRQYSFVLAAIGVALLWWMSKTQPVEQAQWSWVIALTVFNLYVIEWSFEIPGYGWSTLDRAVQLAALLMFGITAALWVVFLSSAIWPFLRMYRSGASVADTLTRSAHNSGMMIIIVAVGGLLYETLGGAMPLTSLGPLDFITLMAVVIAMQAANEALMQLGMRFSNPDKPLEFSHFNSILEIGGAPLGVVAALIYAQQDVGTLLLFATIFTVLLFVMRRFAEMRAGADRQMHALSSINRVGQAISASLILDDTVELVYEECRKLIEFSSFYLLLCVPDSDEVDIVVQVTGGQRFPRSRRMRSVGMTGNIINSGESILIEDWEAAPEEVRRLAVIVGDAPQSFIGVPVTYRGQVVGAITVQNFRGKRYGEAELYLLRTYADQVAVAIANARMYSELADYKEELEGRVASRTRELQDATDSLRQANQQKAELLDELHRRTDELDRQTKEDGLTGLYNRRFMDHYLAREFDRARRFGHDLAVAMADLDHFKVVNDRFSHGVGDQVLRVVAHLLKDGCRGIDAIGRFGGEEFVLVFPETSGDAARSVCEKLRVAIESYDWEREQAGLSVTISFGIADAEKASDSTELIARADQMLYAAKRAGRNQVVG